jgi:hypothetical protein
MIATRRNLNIIMYLYTHLKFRRLIIIRVINLEYLKKRTLFLCINSKYI